MSHFYRLDTINHPYETAPLAWVAYERLSGIKGPDFDFERGFEEIPLDPPWPHTKMFRAPLVTDEYNICSHIFRYTGEKEFPDIWGGGPQLLVSERVKKIILEFDDFEHQFCETTFLSEDRTKKLNTAPYYQLNVRRFVQIEDIGGTVDNRHNKFRTNYIEDQFLPTVQQSPTLLANLATLPLWRHRMNNSTVYLSEAMLSKLQEAGITGLDFYSQCYDGQVYDGMPYEALARYITPD